MDDICSHLETQVKALIERCENLKQANAELEQGHKNAIAQIENMVSRLKSIERSQ